MVGSCVMLKEFAQYMTWGKLVVDNVGNSYKLIEDMGQRKDVVRLVNMKNWKRYELLKAWIRNFEQEAWGFRDKYSREDLDGWKAEKVSYEESLPVDGLRPSNKIRFITPDYKTKFEVLNLSQIYVDDELVRVAYLDETHFTFVDTFSMNFFGGCFHICQFAELCEQRGFEVRPFEGNDNM